uniref:Uncharacterized protein n=1 Tax=Arundo donax TaxID=35708 RepID=A0A0A8Z610_ARUDO
MKLSLPCKSLNLSRESLIFLQFTMTEGVCTSRGLSSATR